MGASRKRGQRALPRAGGDVRACDRGPFAPGRGLLDDALVAKLIAAALSQKTTSPICSSSTAARAACRWRTATSATSPGIDMGLGVRVVQGEAVGYAFAESLEPGEMLRAAQTASRIAKAGGRRSPCT
ncbi:MAG: hypothetical protein U0168_13480 [Nannocystaceae bacterium]